MNHTCPRRSPCRPCLPVAVGLAFLFLTSCAGIPNRPPSVSYRTNLGATECPVVPPTGLLFTKFRAPLDINAEYSNTDIPPFESLKKGESDAVSMFHLWPLLPGFSISGGGGSIDSAAKDGRLSKVYYADYEYLQVLGIYASFTVIAYGE